MIRPMARGMIAAMAALVAIGANSPRALAPAGPGLWEVGSSATGAGARPTCVADPVTLAQWEHRRGRCTHFILSDVGNKTVIDYSCADGGFGRSEMTLVTPRTLRIATQGISRQGPFNYVLHARRVGNCASR